jgi:hypothetical protein
VLLFPNLSSILLPLSFIILTVSASPPLQDHIARVLR